MIFNFGLAVKIESHRRFCTRGLGGFEGAGVETTLRLLVKLTCCVSVNQTQLFIGLPGAFHFFTTAFPHYNDFGCNTCLWMLLVGSAFLSAGFWSSTGGVWVRRRVGSSTHEQICSGSTGHAESVRIWFDPRRVKYEDLLETFWRLHDPT